MSAFEESPLSAVGKSPPQLIVNVYGQPLSKNLFRTKAITMVIEQVTWKFD